ncbi:hypothetical protein [Bradyrhizobium iriomotense]|uniref:hypothetical protein n=1 Tax=Bradyrhizobium iriomotense TaxID=441950 RepID=UPI001B89FB2C|nr:hypothetical protein [Bradyrhizobium iriomotense]MBR0781907.1 hypothetical protein [Bradyrhizobium iriomotense]
MGALEPDHRMGGWSGVGYDSVEVGTAFPPQPLPIDLNDLARFYRCLGEEAPWLRPGCRIPAFLLNEFKALKGQMRFPPGVLHAQEEIQMMSAAHLGEPLTVEISIVDKFIRNEKRFIVVDQHVKCTTDSRSVAKIKHTLYWPC